MACGMEARGPEPKQIIAREAPCERKTDVGRGVIVCVIEKHI